MADVRLALGSIADDVVVEGLPLPQLPGVRTVFDLRAGSPTPTGCVSLSSRTDWLARRIGYAPASWLFYATGGFAWT
jgi:hypothetical protein